MTLLYERIYSAALDLNRRGDGTLVISNYICERRVALLTRKSAVQTLLRLRIVVLFYFYKLLNLVTSH